MAMRYILFVLFMLAAMSARATLDIEIVGAGEHQIPVSIVPFDGEDALTHKISAVIASDLKRSGLFRLVDSAGKTPHEMREVN